MSGAQVIPAPVGGWNARDALEAMDPADAVQLDNWIPANGVVVGRGGSKTQTTDLVGHSVDTLIPYQGDGANVLLAASNGHIYVVANDFGFLLANSIGSGFTSDAWQWGTFDNTTVMLNGADAPQVFDGTTLSPMTLTTLSAPTISGITTTTGTLAAATYYYKVTATNVNGETTASAEVSHVLAAPGGNVVSWGTITGATGYKIYRSTTTGTEVFLTAVGEVTTFTDDGSITIGSGAPPSTNTTNVDGTKLIDVVNFKGRAFYVEKASQRVWYAAIGSFQGMLTKLDFSTITHRGGYLVQAITWSRDSNDGLDDYFAFIFSTGEILVYQGTDPDFTVSWFMTGRFFMGAPLGRRAHTKFASTEVILSADGFQTLDEAIQNARAELVDSFGGKIFRASTSAASNYKNNFGWQAIYYPRGNLFVANVPIAADNFRQYVRYTNTGNWCQFTGWNARCFALWKERLYFGTNDGNVKLADVQTEDGYREAYSDDGVAIVYNGLTAYEKFGQPGLKTQTSSAQLVMANITDGKALSLNAFADYNTRQLPAIPDPVEHAPGQWDQSPWDTDAWAGTNVADAAGTQTRIFWRPIQIRTGFATAVSLRMKSVLQNPYWYSTKFIFNQAGVN